MGRRNRPTLPSRRGGAVGLSLNGVSSSVLCQLAEDRIREGIILLSQGQPTGAAYISGYAAELLLKAVLATRLSAYGGFWPFDNISHEHKTHNLEVLLKHAGLQDQMHKAALANFELGSNWATLRDQWGPDLRYRRLQRQIASDTVQAVSGHRDGVATWLRSWVMG
jgi:hypothetical protein